MSKLYALVLGLSKTYSASSDALSTVAMCFGDEDSAELWQLGSHQAVFLGRLPGTPNAILNQRFGAALKHPAIDSALLIEAGDWIRFTEAGKSIQHRIAARLRDAQDVDPLASLNRRPTARTRRKVFPPTREPKA